MQSDVKNTVPFVKKISKGYLPWLILLLSMSFTLSLWHYVRLDINRHARADFDFRAGEITQKILHRMRGYEQVLRGGVGYFNTVEAVTKNKWHDYVKSLRIEQNYPGIQGIGFSKLIHPSEKKAHIEKIRSETSPEHSIWPEGERPVYTSIIYLEPLDWRNRRAIGYDMYSEPVRRKAMDMAVEKDMAAISGKVRLVQETDKDVQAGFLMYLPVYRKGMPVSTPEERRKALNGYVYSPFRMNDLMKGITERDIPDLDVEIFNGDSASEDTLMYDSDYEGNFKVKKDALFTKFSNVELNGNVWTIHFLSLPAFEAAIDREKPVIVLATGTVISLLFFVITFVQVSHRERLRAVNKDLNNEVAERKWAEDELRKTHDELESRVMRRTEELTAANAALQNEISIRRQAEWALRESEERFRSLIETTNDLVWEVDGGMSYTYASPAVSAVLGYSPGEIVGKTPFDHMETEDGARFKAALTQAAEAGKPFTIEKKSLGKDGSAVILETSGAPILGAGGEFLGFRGIDRNVTERKLIEKEKEQIQAQLLQGQKMEKLGRLAAGVAHDFNNIMNIITSLNALAMREAEDGALREYLDQIRTASERATNLTRQLLIFSRSQPTEATTLDINKSVDDMSKLLRHIIGENIRISSCLAPGLMPVLADKSSIEQLVMNLVINSKEAMPDGGDVSIKTENVVGEKGADLAPELAAGKYVCVTVRDSGIGMDEDTIKRVFEPFFSTKESGKGIGLGLTVVHDIVKEHKGAISIASRPGEGAVFKVFLPASAVFMPKVFASRPADQMHGRGERILLVEDEVMLSKSVSLVLTKSGYHVFTANDAEEAADIFEKEKSGLQLVFSDVVLKGRSGVNIVDDFLSEKPELKVVFASGYMDIESQWPYVKEKKFRFLQKPYEISELLSVIRESLDGQLQT